MTKREIYRLFIETFEIIYLNETAEGDKKILIQPQETDCNGSHEFMAVTKIPEKV